MTTSLISYPFRLAPGGSVVTVVQDSSDHYAELIATVALTRPGELAQAPLFGVDDPAFDTLDPEELAYKLELFGPSVRIVSIKTVPVTDTEQTVYIEFVPSGTDASGIVANS